MTRTDAVDLLKQYAAVTRDPKVCDLASRVEQHSEGKAMRWLGFVQGILVERGLYTVEDVKSHSRERRVPTIAEDLTKFGASKCPTCADTTVVAFDFENKQLGGYEICLNEDCDYYVRKPEHRT
jgi:hypothetical protein